MEREHARRHRASQQHDHLAQEAVPELHGPARDGEQDRDADEMIEAGAIEAEDDVLGDVQGEQEHGHERESTQQIVLLHRGAP